MGRPSSMCAFLQIAPLVAIGRGIGRLANPTGEG
jgi:hypothetical protein